MSVNISIHINGFPIDANVLGDITLVIQDIFRYVFLVIQDISEIKFIAGQDRLKYVSYGEGCLQKYELQLAFHHFASFSSTGDCSTAEWKETFPT